MKLHNFHARRGDHHAVLIIAIVVALAGALGFVGYNAWNNQQADAGRKAAKAKKAKAKTQTQAKPKAKTNNAAKAQTTVEPNSTEEGYNEGAGTILQRNTSAMRVGPAGASGSSETYVIASYNILQAESFPKKSRNRGQCPQNNPGDPICVAKRSDLQAAIITGQVDNPAFDILGTQETSASQYDALRLRLPNYGVWPSYGPGNQSIRNANGGNALWWNKSKFTQVGQGTYKGFNNRAGEADIPWVALRTASGKVVHFSSSHYANRSHGGTPAKKKQSANRTFGWAGGKSTAVIVGDFNDKKDRDSTYCVLTSNARLQNTFDSYYNANPSVKCPSVNSYKGIDHIYTTPNVATLSWGHLPEVGAYFHASDHTPVYAEVAL
jgi:Tfp pilus assembly protein PilE